MWLRDLPDGYPVAVDTETSGNQVDSLSRIAVVSFAFRLPDSDGCSVSDRPMIARALPFDQGLANLPLGAKTLNARTATRIAKWPEWARDEDAGNLPPHRFDELTQQLKRFRLIWHGGKFDMNHFVKGLRGRPDLGIDFEDELFWDTMLGQRVLESTELAALKATGVRLNLGREIGVKEGMEAEEALALKPWLGPKTGKNADARFDLVPWSVMEKYAILDAQLTLLLKEWQDLQFEDRHFDLRHIRRELDLLKVLYRMEQRGIAFDHRTGKRMETLIERARMETAELLPFDPTPNKARDFFFGNGPGQLGHSIFSDKVTEKRHDPQVDDEVISRLVAEDWPGREIAETYQRHESLKSANSKWYGAWSYLVGTDGRLRTNFKQTEVVSGRLAVGHIQLQAIPHIYQMPKVEGLVGVRDLFHEDTPCPCGCGEMELWEFDISQAEIRIATAVAQCRPMLEGFYRGDDSHSIATRLMFADLFEADGVQLSEAESHPLWDELRQVAKRCNLGILYGAGSRTIQDQIKKFTGRVYSLSQVKTWIDQWNRAFPEMPTALYRYERMAVNNGWVRLVNGRQRWFLPYEPLHKALNQVIQGSLAEVMKDAMIEVENRVPDRMLLQIHDSLVMRLSKCRLEQDAETVTQVLVNTYEEAFTFRWKDTGEKVRVPFVSDSKRFGRKVATS